jgi:DNA-binding MarR family transcriptional regulator
MRRAGWRAMRHTEAALEPLGLRPKHFGLLNLLEHAGGASQQLLGERLCVDPSSIVAIVDDLERAGVVERRRDPSDRRRYAIHLTGKGARLLTRARAAVVEAEDGLLAPLDAGEREQLRELLARLVD